MNEEKRKLFKLTQTEKKINKGLKIPKTNGTYGRFEFFTQNKDFWMDYLCY